MASYTGNLNLKKPALDDDALITDINNNMDILDVAANGIQDALAIVANGNTHVAITAGQFVYVRNHTTLTEGLYVASSNIAANATLSTSNLTADSAGGLNALNSKIVTLEKMANDSESLGDMTAHVTKLHTMAKDGYVCIKTNSVGNYYAQINLLNGSNQAISMSILTKGDNDNYGQAMMFAKKGQHLGLVLGANGKAYVAYCDD